VERIGGPEPDPFGDSRPQRATFIVRLWRDRPDAPAGWRGSVEYVQGGERRAAADAAGTLALVELWLETLED
jgi:hypothetical protein